MAKKDVRQSILDAGLEVMHAKGYNGCSVQDITEAAEVPKGSFYHYFGSKEQYGQALLESFFDAYIANLDQRLDGPGANARERLLAYWQSWLSAQEAGCEEPKCLVVKLSAEVADLSDGMRVTLRDGTERIIARIARCIAAGCTDGSLAVADPVATSRTLYSLWLGASLLAKLHRNTDALREAMTSTLAILDP